MFNRKFVFFVFTVCVWILCSWMTIYAATIHVPADYTTIQAGIDAADDGDTVLVADGTYTGDGKRDNGKDITLQSQNNADSGETDTSLVDDLVQNEYVSKETTIVDFTATITVESLDERLSEAEKTKEVILGIDADATDGYDADLDITTEFPPPPIGGAPFLDAAFYAGGLTYLSKDMRVSKSWTLIVSSSGKITLSWDNTSVPANYPLYIDGTDMSTQSCKEFTKPTFNSSSNLTLKLDIEA